MCVGVCVCGQNSPTGTLTSDEETPLLVKDRARRRKSSDTQSTDREFDDVHVQTNGSRHFKKYIAHGRLFCIHAY